jgi:LysR family glycine cleavage system transcriptional activator
MADRMPPLNALRAFEAAARHANFARAAGELHVTAGALSHQIRGLEAFVGTPLFERQARGVALTPQGRLLVPGLSVGFAAIREAVAALRAGANSGIVVVSAPPGFTSKWLAPRLYRFAAAHPEVELRIAASAAYANFVHDGIDLAVRSVPTDQPRDLALDYEKLVDDRMVALCSPALQAKVKRAAARGDLRGIALIHDDQLAGRPEVPAWADWCRAAGIAPVDARRGLRFSSAEHAIDAAVQGAGLLLTHTVLAHDELAAGRLVLPIDLALPAGRTYFMVRPKARPLSAGVEALSAWLRKEMVAAARAMPLPAVRRGKRRVSAAHSGR